MTDEISILAKYRPLTSGPSPEFSHHAERDFTEFLKQQETTTSRQPEKKKRRRSRPLVLAVLAVALLAAGGVAVAVIGDGLRYVGPATPITETDDLSLVVQESNIGPCLEVRKADGTMAGGCGADLSEPLSISVGSVGQSAFADGWAPPTTAKLEMIFANGEAITVTTFQTVDEYDVLFFVIPLNGSSAETSLPIQAVAYDDQGNTLASIFYDGVSSSAPQQDE
jgi:hypothetical protein